MDWPISHQRQGSRRGTARAGKGQSQPQRQHPLPNCNWLPVANQDFWGFWMVDICRGGRNQRSAPQKNHMAHLRQALPLPPRKLSSWDRGGDKMHPPPGETALTKHWSPKLRRPGKGTKHMPNRVCAFVEYLRT